MAAKKADDPKENNDAREAEKSVELPCRGELTVEISETAPPPHHEKIHRRRPMPPVPDQKRRPQGD